MGFPSKPRMQALHSPSKIFQESYRFPKLCFTHVVALGLPCAEQRLRRMRTTLCASMTQWTLSSSLFLLRIPVRLWASFVCKDDKSHTHAIPDFVVAGNTFQILWTICRVFKDFSVLPQNRCSTVMCFLSAQDSLIDQCFLRHASFWLQRSFPVISCQTHYTDIEIPDHDNEAEQISLRQQCRKTRGRLAQNSRWLR